MYAYLGDIKFEGFKGFSDFTGTNETVLSEHSVIEGKPRLQMTGEKLEEISLKFTLHVSFCNPEKEVEILQSYRRDGQVIPFVAGDGTTYGDFVIKTITRSYVQTDKNGSIVAIELDVTLIEYFVPGQKPKAKSDLLAIKAPAVAVIPKPPVLTDPQIISYELSNINSQTAAMDKEINDADRIASKSDRAIRLAKQRIASVQKSMVKIENVGTTTRNISGMYQSISSSVSAVNGQVAALNKFIQNGDIHSAVGASSQLRNAFNRLTVDSAPINDLVAMRKDAERPITNNGTQFNFQFNGQF